jgi:hypothetical protein
MAKFDINKDGVLDARELDNLLRKIVVMDNSQRNNNLEQQTRHALDLHISVK